MNWVQAWLAACVIAAAAISLPAGLVIFSFLWWIWRNS